jgi:hypothetical protein
MPIAFVNDIVAIAYFVEHGDDDNVAGVIANSLEDRVRRAGLPVVIVLSTPETLSINQSTSSLAPPPPPLKSSQTGRPWKAGRLHVAVQVAHKIALGLADCVQPLGTRHHP